ncbi:MAG: 50S ribosomal protein L35 [Deltaproteobacteria bacterium]|nr:50S ribosomal protein L35 [Deltaproteobacteria bacterium]
MPKLKTVSGAKKRFKRTGTGKIKRSRVNRRHILTSKAQKTKRRLRAPGLVSEVDLPAVRQMMPYG